MSSTPDPAARAVRALARASRVLERSSAELNLAHYRVLSAIASGDERASRVAQRLALGRPAISSAVDALSKRGLLVRGEVDGDQRATALSLTGAGEALLARTEAEMARRLTGLAARTPDGERLLETLAWLGPAIDEAMAEKAGSEKSRSQTMTPPR
ncbi:MarR family winged helix-turn-helix transcriptional regulator [Amycolatopsis sp. PS_44_ISF1]|uniref:MarR family winged helix-turn-helix transcriptional regulator n=1 Tax=Amycolatopsis sp. PS_44_ISF1 TaxID=2974917 RepID=UPI0028DD5179|nr:MarR family winged helix-turn-helix transcriptional regulator [Amycolatopsis sp. PS_44_ISF1]MDT8913408.1 MarR family winged helix-turn-helix transcriptional regulator [Amycolatopsis sp. PS_44_ISF1]